MILAYIVLETTGDDKSRRLSTYIVTSLSKNFILAMRSILPSLSELWQGTKHVRSVYYISAEVLRPEVSDSTDGC